MIRHTGILLAAVVFCATAFGQARQGPQWYGVDREPGWGDGRGAAPQRPTQQRPVQQPVAEVARPAPEVARPMPAVASLARNEPAARSLNAHALVIGNSSYAGSYKLANPANDADAISRKLQSLGFTVTTVANATRSRLTSALGAFSRSAAKADLALLFYAGHGVQVNGVNYLLPTDTNMADPEQVPYEGVSLNSVLEQSMPGKMKLVFLDACRDNPLARTGTRGGGSRGLARVDVSEGTLIAYATKEGSTADDGSGRNSPFTAALLEHLDDPVDVSVMLRKVREKVMRSTNGRQQPWEYGSLVGDELVLSRLKPH